MPVILANLFALVPPEIFILSPSLNPAVSNRNPVPVAKVMVVEVVEIDVEASDIPKDSALSFKFIPVAFACIVSEYPPTDNTLFAIYS